ncbi:unnamed protein product, partial [marine sediment metagenome]
ETFVGDISIIQQTNELNLPYVLGKTNSAGLYSLNLRSGFCSAWSGS